MPEPEGAEAAAVSQRSAPGRLYLIRHGQSTWNRVHRIQGQADPPLSDEGRRQARLLGARLAGHAFAAAYASDLQRAAETAGIVAAATGVEPVPLRGLREIFLGAWEGLSSEEIAKRDPKAWARWLEEPDWDLVPGGEGAAAFEERVARALDGIVEQHPRGDVLVVTHGGVIQVALHRVVGKGSRGIFLFKIQNASISIVERRDARSVVAGVNDVAHLEASQVTEPGLS